VSLIVSLMAPLVRACTDEPSNTLLDRQSAGFL
jgi:hypothetical protein